MIDVLNALRKQRAYRPWKPMGDVPGAKRPIVVSKKKYHHALTAAAYATKLYWPRKRVGRVGPGETKRDRDHSRIKGSQHSQVLLFLDQWKLPQITILFGLTIRRGRLVRNRSKWC